MSEIAQQKKAQQIQINIIIKSVINTKASIARGGLAHGSQTHGTVERVQCLHSHTKRSQSSQDNLPPLSQTHTHTTTQLTFRYSGMKPFLI